MGFAPRKTRLFWSIGWWVSLQWDKIWTHYWPTNI